MKDLASNRNKSRVCRGSVGMAGSNLDSSSSVLHARTVGTAQSRQEETSEMIDSLFGGDEGAGLGVEPGASMFGHMTVLQAGPRPSADFRMQGALERTGLTSSSQFG